MDMNDGSEALNPLLNSRETSGKFFNSSVPQPCRLVVGSKLVDVKCSAQRKPSIKVAAIIIILLCEESQSPICHFFPSRAFCKSDKLATCFYPGAPNGNIEMYKYVRIEHLIMCQAPF